MSPTYWTAFRIQDAARAHGWEFIKWTPETNAWGMCKAGYRPDCACCQHLRTPGVKIMLRENRRGGLVWVSHTTEGTCTYYGPRYRGKLDLVLDWLCDCGKRGEHGGCSG